MPQLVGQVGLLFNNFSHTSYLEIYKKRKYSENILFLGDQPSFCIVLQPLIILGDVFARKMLHYE